MLLGYTAIVFSFVVQITGGSVIEHGGDAGATGLAQDTSTLLVQSETSDMRPCVEGMCKCNTTYADCSQHGVNLTYIPKLPPNITFLNFTGNRALINHDDFFLNITHIEHLELGDNRLSYVSPGAFRPLHRLTNLNLGNNDLTYEALQPVLSIRTLQKLTLLSQGLGPLPPDLFRNHPLPDLEILSLVSNEISQVDMSVFVPLSSLTKLSLNKNIMCEISTTFLPNLQQLLLNNCGLPRFPQTCRNGSSLFPHLQTLALRHNVIPFLPDDICLPALAVLDLSENHFSELPTGMFSPRHFPALQFLQLNRINMKVRQVGKRAFSNPSLVTLQFFFNNLEFGSEGVDPDCFAGCPSLTTLGLTANSFRSVDVKKFQRLFRPLKKLQLLNLGLNNIEHLHVKSFVKLPSLVDLRLYYNRLSSIPDGTFDVLRNLKSLSLGKNLIRVVRETTFSESTRQRLRSLDLSANGFTCDCDLMWFHRWFMSQRSLFEEHAHDNYSCGNIPNKTLAAFWIDEQACLLGHAVYVFLVVVQVIVLLVFFLVIGFCRYRWHIRLVLYESFRGRGDRWRRLQQNHFQYDVFVSYAEADAHWVRQHLMPQLEEGLGLKLCLHQRDFIPGRHIVDNIVESVESSKKILMLFSSDFAKSAWCQFELNLCLSHVMEHDDALVITYLHDIPSRDLTAAMMAVMKTTTYIEWADDPDASASFWGRLRIAFNEILPFRAA